MNLNTNDWKSFRVGKLFNMMNGKGITQEEISDNEGDFIAVQSGEENNGVIGKISLNYCKQMKYTYSEKPCLTVARSGSAGFVSFQINGCVVGDSAKILLLSDDVASIEVYTFLQAVLTANRFKYTYGRKVTEDKYLNDLIDLPIQHNADGTPLIDDTKKYSVEGYVPNWQFMKDYIKSLHYKPLTTRNKAQNTLEYNIAEWKEFRVGTLFDIHPTKTIDGISSDDCCDFGTTPLVVNQSYNNGVAGFCDALPTEKGGVITFSDTWEGETFFYQPEDFIGFAHVQGMYPKNVDLSPECMIFICTVLEFDAKGRYSYGRKKRRDIIAEVKLKLPIRHNSDGTPYIDNNHVFSDEGYVPDWRFMEEYIKSLPYGDRI